jgi:GGDEF domain-containing protein
MKGFRPRLLVPSLRNQPARRKSSGGIAQHSHPFGRFLYNEELLPTRLSIGVATFPTHATDADSLERAADRALYAAKAGGRDRVEIVDASVSPIGEDAAIASLTTDFALNL